MQSIHTPGYFGLPLKRSAIATPSFSRQACITTHKLYTANLKTGSAVYQPALEFNYPPPSSAVVKNGRSYAPQLALHTFVTLQGQLWGWDSSVTATRYGLDGPGIESRWGARFAALVQTGPGDHPASYTIGTGSFPGVEQPGRGVYHPPSSSAEIEGRVELYICSPSGASWIVLGSAYYWALHKCRSTEVRFASHSATIIIVTCFVSRALTKTTCI